MIPEITGTWVSGVQSVLHLLWNDYVVYADSRPLAQYRAEATGTVGTISTGPLFEETTTMCRNSAARPGRPV